MKWNRVSKVFINGKKLIKNKSLSVKKHAPAIATGFSIFCWGSSLILMGLEAPKAHEVWNDKKERDPEATKLELAAAVAPVLWKPVALAALGAGGEIISLKMMNARVLAATSLATMAMNDRNAIYSAAKDIVGDEKAEEIRHTANAKTAEKEGKKFIDDDIGEPAMSGDEEVRKIEFGLTGAAFYSSPAKIKKGMEDAIATFVSNDEICVNDIASYIGAPTSEIGGMMMYTFNAGPYSTNIYERARQQLRYELVPMEDEYGKLGWSLEMAYSPSYCNS